MNRAELVKIFGVAILSICLIGNNFTPYSTIALQTTEMKVSSMDWSPDGTRIALGDYQGSVYIWDINSSQVVLSQTTPTTPARLSSEGKTVFDVEWSPDGTRIAVADGVGIVWIMDANTGSVLKSYDAEWTATAVSWDPTGTKLAGAVEKNTRLLSENEIRIWDIASDQILLTLN